MLSERRLPCLGPLVDGIVGPREKNPDPLEDKVTTGYRIVHSVLYAGLILTLLVSPSAPQGLSSRTITIVVPYTAGTGIDILARIVGEELQQRWSQPVVVENKPGASGNIGTQYA